MLLVPRHHDPAGGGPAPAGALVTLALMFALVMFGQEFHYIIDVPPLYYMSKAWPLITLPLAVYGVANLELPYKRYFIILSIYLLCVAPLMSIIYFHNGVIDAVATTAKIWPFLYYFSLSAMMHWLAPPRHQVHRVLVILGAATLIIVTLLWITVPLSQYTPDPKISRVFMYEYERGYRIYVPMIFAFIYIFYLTRLFLRDFNVFVLITIILCYTVLFVIYKQRTPIACMFAVTGVIGASKLRGWWRITIVIVLGAIGAGAVIEAQRLVDHITTGLGASLSVRETSISTALSFLSQGYWRWIMGVGSVTRYTHVPSTSIFSSPLFYLTDIGWIGITFEYGLIGAVLIFGGSVLPVRASLRAAARTDDLIVKAVADYALYVLLSYAVYSAVFAPGELMTAFALVIYESGRATRSEGTAAAAKPAARAIDVPGSTVIDRFYNT